MVDFQAEKVEAATVSPESSESFQDSAYLDDDFELDSKVSNNLKQHGEVTNEKN